MKGDGRFGDAQLHQRSPYVLLVEGQDEVRFFDAFLRHLGLTEVQVVEVGGKDKFLQEFPAFLNDPGFSSIRSYAIIRDADRDASKTFQSICGLLGKYDHPVPRRSGQFESRGSQKVGVFVIPGNREEGILEDLCLQTVQDHPAVSCVDRFIECLGSVLEKKVAGQPVVEGKAYFPKNESKARVLAFLAGMHKTVNKLGEAADQGCWQFDHPALDELRAFLQELSS